MPYTYYPDYPLCRRKGDKIGIKATGEKRKVWKWEET